jgi:amphi-Trp domain-containing protein
MKRQGLNQANSRQAGHKKPANLKGGLEMGKKEIKLKGNLETAKTADYLNDLAAGLKAGDVYIQKGGEFVSLKPGLTVDFEIEAVKKKHKEKLVIEISWHKEESDEFEGENMKISSADSKEK